MSVDKRPDGRYRVRWRDPYTGRQRSRHFKLKREADAYDAQVRTSKLRGTYVDPSDKTTVVEYAQRWAVAQPHRPGTARQVQIQIRRLAGCPLGQRRLGMVLRTDVQAWVTSLSREGLAPRTVARAFHFLRTVLRAAAADRLIGTSPTTGIVLPKPQDKPVVPLTVAQVQQLADTVQEDCRALVLAQAGLGLRRSEVLALRVQDIRFLDREVRVEYQLNDRTRERVEPKTLKSRRTVPLPAFVAEALAEHIRRFPPLEDGSLFYAQRSRTLRLPDGYGRRIIVAAVERLAAEPGSTFPAGTTSHTLRHTYASWLIEAGESPVAVAERLGHESPNMVLQVYGHLMPDSEERTRKVLDAAWSNDGAARNSTAAPEANEDSGRTLEAP